MKAAEAPVVDFETFARAGAALKDLNSGKDTDLTPCGIVADVLKRIRTEDGFHLLDKSAQARLRTAAATVKEAYGKEEKQSALLNFLSEAYGATRRPAKAEPTRRDRVGTFLLNAASAA